MICDYKSNILHDYGREYILQLVNDLSEKGNNTGMKDNNTGMKDAIGW